MKLCVVYQPAVSASTSPYRVLHNEGGELDWASFRTYRDLALVGLMLLDGLRSCEVLALVLEDLQLAEGQIRVHGKGNKERPLPLHPDILDVLGHYLRLERPLTNTSALFVSLKGRQRGQPLNTAGLRSLANLELIFETQIRTLALTLRPGTVDNYRYMARRFLSYLRSAFPQLRQISQLRRDPHLLGWFRWLTERQPPQCNKTRISHLFQLRRLLDDLASNGHPVQPDLIRQEDFPSEPRYLPRPLSPQEDQLLQQELLHTDDLYAHALLLIRATGIRLGECIHLPLGCLRQVGAEQWALHVPLGKLHTERLVPVDIEVRRIVERILTLRSSVPAARFANSKGFLLPRRGGLRYALVKSLRSALDQAAKRAGCVTHVTPHRLRHSFATDMLRLGVSLPALMKLLGHKDIKMSLRYVQVTQQDLQREFHQARQNAAHPHRLPTLAVPKELPSAALPSVCQALEATRHLLEMYRRQLGNEKTHRRLQRLDKRLLTIASELRRIQTEEK